MLDLLLNSLPAAANHWFAARHGFQVHASQALVAAGQYEYGAASHGLGNLGPALAAGKLNLPTEAQVARHRFKPGAIRPFSDDAAAKAGKGRSEIFERSQNQFVAFAAQQVADDQNLRVEWCHLSKTWRKQHRLYTTMHDRT